MRHSSAVARLSDADRAVAAELLRAAWLEGRLTLPELEQRVAAALNARVTADLDLLLSDLPQPDPPTPLLAGWFRRSVALVLDHVLIGAAAAVVAGIGALAGDTLGTTVAAALLAPVAAIVYFTVAHGSRSGRTVGERICGIAVRVDPHRGQGARRASYGQAFGRAVMLYVFAGLALWGVGLLDFLWPLWDAKKQTWHDKVAGTIVVRAPAGAFERRRWLRRWRRLR